MAEESGPLVAVVGAGPAGLFATRALVASGCRVALLNRDVKPGGLAEYGIFLDKYKMKGGLRRQFQRILSDPHVTYLGNVAIGAHGDMTVDELSGVGFDALVFAVGAQGTKYLGLPGERLPGVHHAKDLVYHYNRLPPFAEREYPIRRRVAIVGVGNVMVDIANYAIHYCDTDEVIAVARRGPFEKAYDDREFEDIEDAFDRERYRQELERIRPRLAEVGQDPDDLLRALAERPAPFPQARARLGFRFLASPRRVMDINGRVGALEVEDNRLTRQGERVSATGTGVIDQIPCDTVIFAVGDRVDEDLGLPYRDGLYLTAPGDDPAAAYCVWDPARQERRPGCFVVGWARRASDGVVGRARMDAEAGVKHALAYLAERPRRPDAERARLVRRVVKRLTARTTVVTYADVQRIEAAERARAAAAGVEEDKFRSNREMLQIVAGSPADASPP